MVFYLEQVLDLVLAKYSEHVRHPDKEPGTKDHCLSRIEILKPRKTHEKPKVTWVQHMGTAYHEKSNREGLPRPRTALPCSWESSLRLNCEYSTKSALIWRLSGSGLLLRTSLRPSLSEVCRTRPTPRPRTRY